MPDFTMADLLAAQTGAPGPVYEGGPTGNVTPADVLTYLHGVGRKGAQADVALTQSLKDALTGAVLAPGRAATGAYDVTPETPGQYSDVDEARRQINEAHAGRSVFDLASIMMGGGAPAAEPGAAGIFGGKLAKTADLNALKDAQGMISAGKNPMETYQKTGWFKGPDDQWRFEISDRGMGLSPPAAVAHANADFGSYPYFHNADVVMNHPELFQAYPDLWKVNARLEKSNKPSDLPSGAYEQYESGKEGIKINAAYPPQASSLMLHELQHAIQQREGFAQGADFNAVGRDAYQRSAGEVEARNVQRRWDLTPEERKAKPPWITQDYPYPQQIIDSATEGGQGSLFSGGNKRAGKLLVGIRAYHGSPYDFEKFDLSRIGTGEGAQAYGHGMYFAENPAVAAEYKKTLSTQALEDFYRQLRETGSAPRPTPPTGKMYEVNINAKPEQFLDYEKPISEQPDTIRQVYQRITGSGDPAEAAAKVRQLQAQMDELAANRDPVTNQMRGESEWFKLANQRDKVWEQWNAAQSGAKTYDALASASAMRQSPIWQDISANTNRRAAASELLQREGIPGIKYLDQGSRNPGFSSLTPQQIDARIGVLKQDIERGLGDTPRLQDKLADLEREAASYKNPTSNYVVFNPDIVDIRKKWALLLAAMGGAGVPTMGSVLQSQSQPTGQ